MPVIVVFANRVPFAPLEEITVLNRFKGVRRVPLHIAPDIILILIDDITRIVRDLNDRPRLVA